MLISYAPQEASLFCFGMPAERPTEREGGKLGTKSGDSAVVTTVWSAQWNQGQTRF